MSVIATSWNLAPVTLTLVKLSLSFIVRSNESAEIVAEVRLGALDIVISPALPEIFTVSKLANPTPRAISPKLPAAASYSKAAVCAEESVGSSSLFILAVKVLRSSAPASIEISVTSVPVNVTTPVLISISPLNPVMFAVATLVKLIVPSVINVVVKLAGPFNVRSVFS